MIRLGTWMALQKSIRLAPTRASVLLKALANTFAVSLDSQKLFSTHGAFPLIGALLIPIFRLRIAISYRAIT